MFAASKTSTAVSAAEADPFFDNVTALVNTSGTNGAQNNTFIDSSTNNFTITRNGNTTQGSFSPFGENWSNYFDGTGDYLSFTNVTGQGVNFGTGNFTVELWYYMTDSTTNTTYQTFIRQDTTTGAFDFGYRPGASQLVLGLSGLGEATASVTLSTNAWNHIAVSRSGTSLRFFVNGAQVGTTATNSFNFSVTGGTVRIGSNNFNTAFTVYGYLSNLRCTKSALYTANFTPSTVPLQPIAGTSLLTCKDPNIVDDSPNQFTITRNGDVSVQKFGPFAGTTLPTPYYGAYFDGSGDVLTLGSNAALAFATGNFTLEMWYYTTVTPTATNVCPYNNGSGNFFLQIRNTAFGIGVVGSAENNAFSFNFVAGQWYHVAVAREGSTVRGFVDGTLVGTGSNSINYGQNGATIGGLTSSSQLITGHLSNLRVVKGQALYTSSFTPSTTPLTTTSQGATAGNVSLLTCQSSTFVDNSTNNFAITAVGNSRPTTFAPFAVTYSSLQSYTPAVFGGSGYFDGTGDYVSAPANAAFQLTGDFTVEAWVYPTAINTFNMIFGSESGTNSDYLALRASTLEMGIAATSFPVWTRAFVVNQWYHIVVTRQSSTLRAFVNGVQLTLSGGSATNSSQLFQSSAALSVGRYGNTSNPLPFTGYISSARVVKGTALYTSNFVPQNAPLTAVTNTSLLLNATNAGIYDASTLNDFETVGNAQVSTSVKKYGTSSVAFDGSGDYLTTANKPTIASYPGDFTIECWFYLNTVSGTQTIVTNRNGTSGSNAYVPFIFWTESNLLKLYVSSNNSSWNVVNGATLATVAAGQWYYLAYTRSGSSCRVFINGSSVYTFTSSAVFTTANPLQVGMTGPGETNSALNGYVQDLRITQGIARYTANFTPPTALLPTF